MWAPYMQQKVRPAHIDMTNECMIDLPHFLRQLKPIILVFIFMTYWRGIAAYPR